MTQSSVSTSVLDVSAIGVSGLCLIHCLALPFLSVVLPVAGALGEAEWLHKVFVLAALPITAAAIFQDRRASGWREFAITAATGLAILVSAAFIETLHDFESPLTVIGAGLLALAHGLRWQRRAHL